MRIFTFPASFQINQIQNSAVQIQKMKNWTFSFQLRKFSADDARHENVPPPLDLNRILKSCLKRTIEVNSQKHVNSQIPRDIIAWYDWSKPEKRFPVTHVKDLFIGIT